MEMFSKLLTHCWYLSPPGISVFSDNPGARCGNNYYIANTELQRWEKDKEEKACDLLKKCRSWCHANYNDFTDEKDYSKIRQK